jgi:hypothetical protein
VVIGLLTIWRKLVVLVMKGLYLKGGWWLRVVLSLWRWSQTQILWCQQGTKRMMSWVVVWTSWRLEMVKFMELRGLLEWARGLVLVVCMVLRICCSLGHVSTCTEEMVWVPVWTSET